MYSEATALTAPALSMTPTEALQDARRRDPRGHWIHLGLAALALVLLPLFTAPSSVAFALLLVFTLLRLPHTWRCYAALRAAPVLWLMSAWAGWYALSTVWSANPAQGLDEVKAFRVLLLPLLLWPVIEHIPVLIAAALVGVLAQHGVQTLQALGWYERDVPNRLEGALHGIQTGGWCAAALCWHTSALLCARGPLRWASAALAILAGLGLIATGSRGPWIAAAVALPLLVLVVAVRRPAARPAAGVVAALGLLAAIGVFTLGRPYIQPRIDAATSELHAALDHGDYGSSVGARIAMWSWAWRTVEDHPLLGVGAGGYKSVAVEFEDYQAAAADPHDERWFGKDHAHSVYLHTLACTGLPGGVLLVATLALLVRQCWRDPPDHPWADGTVFVVITWLVGAQFDAYHLNAHLLGLLALAAALTLPGRPTVQSLHPCRTPT